ncbi:MAG: hypothetical protein ACREBS_04760, partial [Nitrososphaerales archaeon]
ALVTCASPIFGLVPAEISDVYPTSQITQIVDSYPAEDLVLNSKTWRRIDELIKPDDDGESVSKWLHAQLRQYSNKRKVPKNLEIVVSRNYKAFKARLATRYR